MNQLFTIFIFHIFFLRAFAHMFVIRFLLAHIVEHSVVHTHGLTHVHAQIFYLSLLTTR